jgi:glycosyltransferase involved in cell wall biosynthesis
MKVTVIMPVYNAAAYIYEAIDSILKQSFTDFELLIINDGSTDASMQIVESFKSPKIRVLHNLTNKGLVFTRNRGIEEAKGEYLAWLDADDYALPQRLETQVNFMENHKNIALLGSYTDYMYANGEIFYTAMPKTNTEELPIWLLFQNCFPQSSVMIRKNALFYSNKSTSSNSNLSQVSPINLRYREEFPPAEDYDLWVQLAYYQELANLPQTLVRHRKHDENTSRKMSVEQENNILKILNYQLENLGILPNKEELKLHRQLSHYAFSPNLLTYQQIENWLTKLKIANDKTKKYLPKYFNQVIAEIWQKTSSIHLQFGGKALNIFLNCQISKEINFVMKLRLVISFLRNSFIKR